MNIVTIIPARGGSKGVPLKNIRKVGGLPLVARAIRASKGCSLVNKTYVATDSEEIASISENYEASVIWRNAEISSDTASSESVLLFCLKEFETLPDLVVFLQCTSPFVKSKYIEQTIERLLQTNADSAFAVIKNHKFLWKASENGTAIGINHDGKKRLRRQDLPPEYLETGSIYVFRTKCFLTEKTRFCGKTVLCCFDDELLGFEVDSLIDLKVAEILAKENSENINFDNIKLMVFDFDGVFTDNKVYIDQNGYETVMCDRADGMGIERLRLNRPDLEIMVLSKETNPVVLSRCKKLKINCINGIDDKLIQLREVCKNKKIDLLNVAYMGNDLNDIECMKYVGISICPADANQEVKNLSDLTLSRKGGNGAIRELTDYIIGDYS